MPHDVRVCILYTAARDSRLAEAPAAAPSDRRAKTATAQRKSRPKRFRAIRARGKFDGDGRARPFPLPTRQRTNARKENAIPRWRLWGRRPRAVPALCLPKFCSAHTPLRCAARDFRCAALFAARCGAWGKIFRARCSAPVPSQDTVRARETPFHPAVWESNFCLEQFLRYRLVFRKILKLSSKCLKNHLK